eukprot:CAMPEP_0178457824 /NCGR_PEP_ID=MMETSP0689_2-20121128/47224_1 /TAXON_ID=160604 /ORGANISM="Amphidinium massartii, Strain CS-259" /LENGTH=184 /DNA_ID=CAMNT_0020084103 /DNA_START=745 /DNA_END=1299 /DNA_ORIENTATION=+
MLAMQVELLQWSELSCHAAILTRLVFCQLLARYLIGVEEVVQCHLCFQLGMCHQPEIHQLVRGVQDFNVCQASRVIAGQGWQSAPPSHHGGGSVELLLVETDILLAVDPHRYGLLKAVSIRVDAPPQGQEAPQNSPASLRSSAASCAEPRLLRGGVQKLPELKVQRPGHKPLEMLHCTVGEVQP